MKSRDMIPIYRLMSKYERSCPTCNRKLSATPKKIELTDNRVVLRNSL
jgi:hypothetical protein